jgi:hypothetical protein
VVEEEGEVVEQVNQFLLAGLSKKARRLHTKRASYSNAGVPVNENRTLCKDGAETRPLRQ